MNNAEYVAHGTLKQVMPTIGGHFKFVGEIKVVEVHRHVEFYVARE